MTQVGTVTAGVVVVHTTGIYCRADCAARPLARNTGRMPTAVAAEAAGYRPCLRCRSDHLPVAALDDSMHPHVVQALDLISHGFLDRQKEADLAATLGYSTRQMRRVFHEGIGATPSQVATARRAHFARMLLDDTDLTVTDIAFASGFGSLRRMNEVMRTTFRLTPTALRSKRAKGDRSSIDGGLRLQLRVEHENPFDQHLAALAARAVPGVEVVEAGRYRRAIDMGGHPGVVEVSSPRPGDVEIVAHVPTLRGLIDVVAGCRRVFRLDHVEDGPPGVWSPFETDVVAIVRSGCPEPVDVLARLVARFGAPVPDAEAIGVTHRFPEPDALAAIEAADVEGLGPATARAIAALAAAGMVRAGSPHVG